VRYNLFQFGRRIDLIISFSAATDVQTVSAMPRRENSTTEDAFGLRSFSKAEVIACTRRLQPLQIDASKLVSPYCYSIREHSNAARRSRFGISERLSPCEVELLFQRLPPATYGTFQGPEEATRGGAGEKRRLLQTAGDLNTNKNSISHVQDFT
jgi:hypothetical protein